MRIGFSRVYSSRTSALRPATRPMMNSSAPTFPGKTEDHRDARIDRRVHSMAESRQPCPGGLRLVDEPPGSLVDRDRVAARSLQAGRDQLHAALAGAAVLVADRQH